MYRVPIKDNNRFAGQNGQTVSHVADPLSTSLSIGRVFDEADESELFSIRPLHHIGANAAHNSFIWASRSLNRQSNVQAIRPGLSLKVLPVTDATLVSKHHVPRLFPDIEISNELLLV